MEKNMEKKPGLAVLIAMKAKKNQEGDKEGNRHLDSAEEMLSAIKENDAEKFSELLKSYIETCLEEQE